MEITSRDNALVKEWKKLACDPRFRRKSGRFALEGARLCADAALSGVPLPAVLVTDRAREQYASYMEPLLSRAQRVFAIPEPLAAHLAETTTPQGVFAVGERQEQTLEVTPRGRYLALEDVQDPANMGTVIRTAEAMGVEGLLLSAGCCDLYSPKVLRGSMGGVFRLPTLTVSDMPAAVRQWQDAGLTVFACVVDERAERLTDIAFSDGAVCLIGNEGSGLKPATADACARRITIPMSGRAESLNASMAAGIVLWELTRGRLSGGEG